jgi:Tol biopolymer transport system component
MTSGRTNEPDFSRLLGDLAMESPPYYRDDIVRRTARMPQRPAWTFPERWLPVDLTTQRVTIAPFRWRPIAVLFVLAALLIATLMAVTIGNQRKLPAPPYGPAGNGLIAYEADGDIYLGDPLNGSSRAVVSGSDNDLSPAFSRDGTSLFFLRGGQSSNSHLMMANPDGTDVRAVTPEPVFRVSGGDWSSDGRYVLILSVVDFRPTMSIVDTDDGSVRRLDVGMVPEAVAFRPPDGRQIAFSVGSFSDSAIYVVDRDGGVPVKLADGGWPTYSPDGSQIAYGRSYQPEVERNETRVMNADGSNDRLVGDRPDVQYQGTPVWSPDGTKVLVFRALNNGRLLLAAVPADGSGPGQEYNVDFTGGFGGLGWSPDGSQIVSMPADEQSQASLVNLADGVPHLVPRWYTSNWQRLAP